MSKSLEKLSSGFRINRASDDAAGLAISQQMRADITSYKVCSRNVSEANSMLQVAEGAMDQIGNMLSRLKELATQAASANSSSNMAKIDAEGNKLLTEIDRIANATEYAGAKLVDGSFGVTVSSGTFNAATRGFSGVSGLQSNQTYTLAVSTLSATTAGKYDISITATIGGQKVTEKLFGVTPATSGTTVDVKFQTLGLTMSINNALSSLTANGGTLISHTATGSDFQVGAKNTTNDRISVALGSITTGSSALNLTSSQMQTASSAQAFMASVDIAISYLSTQRGAVGANQNRLGYASATLSTTIENTIAAESVIRDADMAAEMTTLSKNQILMQAGTAMLAQANAAPQQLLALFR